MTSTSFEIAKPFLGKKVTAKFDRPLGTKHPKYNYYYPVNYGYLPGVVSADGSDLDVYYLGYDDPADELDGVCIAIIHREDDDDDKLVVVPEGQDITDEQIMQAVRFQEQYFKSSVIRE
ncbi:MAG: inorganic diphosphatase [Patescibacteria group bacterium]